MNAPRWSRIIFAGMALGLNACASPRTPTPLPTFAPTGTVVAALSATPTTAPSTPALTATPTALPATPTFTSVPPTASRTLTTRATATPTIPAFVLNSPANVRHGPGVAYAIIGNLAAGAQAEVIGRDATGKWLVIVYRTARAEQGWVAQQVGVYSGEVKALPVVAAPPLPPTPTATTAPRPVVGARGITGQLTLCNPKTIYAVNERICFNERIVNTTSTFIPYGILGVLAVSTTGGPTQFQTSWGGDLGLNPGCVGPTDRCGGPWEDGMRIATPGAYVLTMQICYSPIDTCLTGGEWESLTGGLAVTVN